MLHDNSITDTALWPLCKSVRLHPMLNTIWIGKNQITDVGAAVLAVLVEKNKNFLVPVYPASGSRYAQARL